MNGIDQDYTIGMFNDFGPSRHFTFLFNLFVMLQIFNFFNARMLKDEFNVFKRNFFKLTYK